MDQDLSWPEAERFVSRGRLGTRAQRLLLLLPALGDANTPKEAVGLVAAALLTVGIQACDPAVADEAARELLEHPAHWTWQDEVLVCDYDHAVRRQGGMRPEDLLLAANA